MVDVDEMRSGNGFIGDAVSAAASDLSPRSMRGVGSQDDGMHSGFNLYENNMFISWIEISFL